MFAYYAVVFLLGASIALERPSIITKFGPITGTHKISYNGRTYSAFEGIPYAKPPVGKLRFEAPVEPDRWEKTLDANTKYTCPQIDFLSQNYTGTEDCLYLNVYIPKDLPNPSDNMDVIVTIHGGAFIIASANMAGPLFFMDRDVIFVNLNYRLGALGFLSTEDNVVPGNNGLKDQRMALQWIQDNIYLFGGNPKSVTITGASAGGSSVHLHYMSKKSKGLFHRGVSQSGTALAPWAFQEGALERANALAVLVGCTDTLTTRIVIECLKSKSSEDIIEQTSNLRSPVGGFPIALFAPVVEIKSDSAFLDEYPYQLLSRGEFFDLPWFTSICEEEGILGLKTVYNELNTLDEKFNKFAHYYLDYNYTACITDRNDIAQKIREQYFGTEKIGKDTYRNIIQLFGDRMFDFSLEKSARMQAKLSKSKVYSYIYGYKNSFFGKVIGMDDLDVGVGHTEDSLLLYDVKLLWDESIKYVLSKTDELIKDMMLDMYVSFAESGVPKINGLTLDAVSDGKKFTYLSIKGITDIKMNVTDELTPTKFWEALPIIENEKFPIDSCDEH